MVSRRSCVRKNQKRKKASLILSKN